MIFAQKLRISMLKRKNTILIKEKCVFIKNRKLTNTIFDYSVSLYGKTKTSKNVVIVEIDQWIPFIRSK